MVGLGCQPLKPDVVRILVFLLWHVRHLEFLVSDAHRVGIACK